MKLFLGSLYTVIISAWYLYTIRQAVLLEGFYTFCSFNPKRTKSIKPYLGKKLHNDIM